MKIKKIIAPIIVTVSSGIVIALLKNKNPKNTAKVISSATKIASDTVSKAEKMFGGITQSKIDELVKNTYRGIKAVINGDTLEYWYKSNSGKSTNMVRLTLDAAGKINAYLGNGPYFYAGSPRIFTDKLVELMQKI